MRLPCGLSVTLVDCQIVENHAEQGVGGVSVDGVTMFLIDTCTFGQNIGGNGAAVAVNSTVIPGTCKQAQDCAALVTSSTFVQNTVSLGSIAAGNCEWQAIGKLFADDDGTLYLYP
ncbi:TPA: hypothetical protein ACH3X1_015127 [Trebouxia sp. C0004]